MSRIKFNFDSQWPNIRPVILRLLKQEAILKSEWTDLFMDIHNLCSWDEKCIPKMKCELEAEILKFIKTIQEIVMQHHDDEALLRAYIQAWSKFFDQTNYLPRPFFHMEQNHNSIRSSCSSTSKQQAQCVESFVKKLMLDTWNKSIFCEIKQRLQNSAMKLIYSERLGETFDSQLVIGVRESYVNLCSDPEDKLKIYRENFEKAYLDSVVEFHNIYTQQFIRNNGIIAYLNYAHVKLNEEEKRGQKYLETSKKSDSIDLLNRTCVESLVTKYQDEIIAECKNLIQNNDLKNLNLMFTLLDKIPNIDQLLVDLEKYIINEGLMVMRTNYETLATDSEKYVEQLLELYNRFTKLVEDAFNGDPRFMTSRDRAFKTIVNDTSIFQLELPSQTKAKQIQPESRCAELLANYCDFLLRRNQTKKLTEEEIKEKLVNVVTLLKYVQNKDVFMKYHKAHLTRRLILELSSDQDLEELTLIMLKDIGMPPEYINKLMQMFKDVKVSNDINERFKEVTRNNLNNNMIADVNIRILNAGAWSRSSDKVAVTLPRVLEDYIPEVEKFYKNQHSGRKLTWHHMMSNGIINFQTKLGKFELEVTTFQMAVLFAWNSRSHDRLSYESLKLATELPDLELRRTLWQLVAFQKLKHQVICYEPEVKQPKEFTDLTQFWINSQFCIVRNNKPQFRGKLNLIGRLQLSTEKHREEENQEIEFLRNERCREAVVKILKMRKRVTHAQLQTEVIELLKNMFLPSKKLIKETIEWLIENKYVERDENNINVFIYTT